MSGASTDNFEPISHIIILLLLLNVSNQMSFAPEKPQFKAKNLFSVTGICNVLWQGQYVFIHIQQTYGCNRLSQRKVQPRCSFSSTVPTFRDWHFQNGYFQAPSAKVHVTPKGSFKWGTGTWISSRNINRKEQPIQM